MSLRETCLIRMIEGLSRPLSKLALSLVSHPHPLSVVVAMCMRVHERVRDRSAKDHLAKS